MAQLLAPRSARIGVPNVTGYKRIVWHKACADPRISLVMLKASPFRALLRPVCVGSAQRLGSFACTDRRGKISR